MSLENTEQDKGISKLLQDILYLSSNFSLRLFSNHMWYLCNNKPKCIFLPLLFSFPFWTLMPSYFGIPKFNPTHHDVLFYTCRFYLLVSNSNSKDRPSTLEKNVLSWTQKDSNKKTRKGSWGDKNAHPHSEETGNSSLSRHLTWLQELLQRNEHNKLNYFNTFFTCSSQITNLWRKSQTRLQQGFYSPKYLRSFMRQRRESAAARTPFI